MQYRNKISDYIKTKSSPTLSIMMFMDQIRNEIKAEMASMHSTEMERIKGEMEKEIEKNVRLKLETIKKGDKGDPGYTPKRGIDFLTSKEQTDFINEIMSSIVVPKDGYIPKAGIDYPTKDDVQKYVQKLVGKIKIKIPENGYTPQKGLDYFTESDIKEITSKIKIEYPEINITGKSIVDLINTLEIRNDLMIDASHIKNLPKLGKQPRIGGGGGVPSLSAGTNITLTPKTDGGFTVIASGGTLTQEQTTDTPNDVLTSFTFAHTPTMIYLNGVFQSLTVDYTVVGKVITFVSMVPTTGSIITNIYQA